MKYLIIAGLMGLTGYGYFYADVLPFLTVITISVVGMFGLLLEKR